MHSKAWECVHMCGNTLHVRHEKGLQRHDHAFQGMGMDCKGMGTGCKGMTMGSYAWEWVVRL